jgi:hypothetical protein
MFTVKLNFKKGFQVHFVLLVRLIPKLFLESKRECSVPITISRTVRLLNVSQVDVHPYCSFNNSGTTCDIGKFPTREKQLHCFSSYYHFRNNPFVLFYPPVFVYPEHFINFLVVANVIAIAIMRGVVHRTDPNTINACSLK